MKIQTDNQGRGVAQLAMPSGGNLSLGHRNYSIDEVEGITVSIPKEWISFAVVALAHHMKKTGWGKITVDEFLAGIGESGEEHEVQKLDREDEE